MSLHTTALPQLRAGGDGPFDTSVDCLYDQNSKIDYLIKMLVQLFI
jgi:hypothetical protein